MAKKSATKKAATKTGSAKKGTKKKSAKGSKGAKGSRTATGTKGTKKSSRKASKRELIDTGTDKRYVRRSSDGQFKESDDQGRSLSQDRKRKAKTASRPGQGDKGDRKRS